MIACSREALIDYLGVRFVQLAALTRYPDAQGAMLTATRQDELLRLTRRFGLVETLAREGVVLPKGLVRRR